MNTVALCGIAVAALFCALFLRQYRPEYGTMLSLAASVGIGICAVSCLYPLIAFLQTRADALAHGGEYLGVMLRALGVSLLTQTCADLCRDAGETALGGKLELLGKAEILVLSLPLLRSLLESVCSLWS